MRSIVKIYDEIFNEMVKQMPVIPPEAGGIMGGKEGRVCRWKFDKGFSPKGCSYSPDVYVLNEIIAEWIDEGYDFMGIVHVHFGGARGLSDSDKNYIEKIMKAMPDYVEKLYFPIVVQPEGQLFSYVAYQNSLGETVIDEDVVEVFF